MHTRWNAIGLVCAILLAGIASVSSAQPDPAVQQEIDRAQQEYAERLRQSRLVGPNDSLEIEMPDGERISLARGCLPPVSRGGVIKIDCTLLDGPAHYFDESTRAMIESCSFWFADLKRCPPKQWPIEVPDCDGAVPQSISGAWRFDALPAAAGFYPVTAGWVMTLDDGSISFDFYGREPIERSYTAVARGEGRYALELRDARSASTTVAIELAPCGMIIEGAAMCDAFCENLADEVGAPTDEELRALVVRSMGDNVDEGFVESILAAAKTRPREPQPLFPERVYFRAVIGTPRG